MKTKLIAPCGMNCALCMAYQREKNHCPGCFYVSELQLVTIVRCIIKNCTKRNEAGNKYCFACGSFPCKRIKQLDKRYRTKYGMSMIENLNSIKEKGIRNFVKDEAVKWKCPACGGVICVHRKQCVACGKERKKTFY